MSDDGREVPEIEVIGPDDRESYASVQVTHVADGAVSTSRWDFAEESFDSLREMLTGRFGLPVFEQDLTAAEVVALGRRIAMGARPVLGAGRWPLAAR